MPNYIQPSLAGYLIFIRGTIGIDAAYLPDDSPFIQWSYDHSLNIVSLEFAPLYRNQPPYAVSNSWGPYAIMVYNLAGHMLIEQCPDQSYPIQGATWASNLATITTPTANSINASQVIRVSGVSSTGTPTGYNGTFTVAAKFSATQIGYAVSPNPGPAVSLVGASISDTFFFTARRRFKMAGFGFVPGVVTSASDQGTSTGLAVPESLKNLTLLSLSLLRTPYGRAYLSYAQLAGPAAFGLT